MFKNYILY